MRAGARSDLLEAGYIWVPVYTNGRLSRHGGDAVGSLINLIARSWAATGRSGRRTARQADRSRITGTGRANLQGRDYLVGTIRVQAGRIRSKCDCFGIQSSSIRRDDVAILVFDKGAVLNGRRRPPNLDDDVIFRRIIAGAGHEDSRIERKREDAAISAISRASRLAKADAFAGSVRRRSDRIIVCHEPIGRAQCAARRSRSPDSLGKADHRQGHAQKTK